MTKQRIEWVAEDIRMTAYNDKKEMLGYLEYERVGTWMHWCWYQFEDIRMSPGCLQEVRDMQKLLLRETRKKNE